MQMWKGVQFYFKESCQLTIIIRCDGKTFYFKTKKQRNWQAVQSTEFLLGSMFYGVQLSYGYIIIILFFLKERSKKMDFFFGLIYLNYMHVFWMVVS